MKKLRKFPNTRTFNRYVLLGVANSLLTYGSFAALALVIDAANAYGIAFALGVLLSSAFSNRWVFKGKAGVIRSMSYGLILTLGYLIGRNIIDFIAPREFIEMLLAGAIALAFTAPITFFVGRFIFLTATPSQE